MASREETALRILAERSGRKNLVVVSRDTAVVPSSGRSLFKYEAASKDTPNEGPVSITLDEADAVVDLISLSALEGVTLFAPVAVAPPVLALPSPPITVNPTTNNLVLVEGDTFSETITVTVPKNTALPKADIYFLADTTGSMTSILASVKAGAGAILAALGGGPLDVVFGVGNYKDFPIPRSSPYAFQHQLNPTANALNVQNAINAWSASGGLDGPEGQLFALNQLAQNPGGPIGWRANSKRIIVWFGDAPGHDPVCKAISGAAQDVTEASATANLVAQKITVLAISTVTGFPAGLDDNPAATSTDYTPPCLVAGAAGQATRITAATGGTHTTGINAANIVTTIINVLKAAVATINNISLVPAGGTTPFVTSIVPPGGFGPIKLDVDHVLKFDVLFTGVVPCTKLDQVFTGFLNVVADGVIVAQKKVTITVPPCKHIYSVKFVCGVQADSSLSTGAAPQCTPVRPGSYSTEINIHNFTHKQAVIEKRVLVVVFAGEAVGREPRFVRPRAQDRIVLPPDTATMDDCCRIEQLLFPAGAGPVIPLTIGFLEIISTVELNVTAVYTAADLKSNSLSIDVEQIEGRLT